jgi:hypothetical protein
MISAALEFRLDKASTNMQGRREPLNHAGGKGTYDTDCYAGYA